MQSTHALEGIPARLWRMVSVAPHRLLMVDYDGTLAPFTVNRDEARPAPGTLSLLRRIAAGTHTSVAIVSGRPLREVEELVGELPATFVGEHGWERRAANGILLRGPIDREICEALLEGERIANAAGWGDLLELKRSAIVLHTRALGKERTAELQDLCIESWKGLARGDRMIVDRIDGGVELRARGRDKGTAVLSLISQAPAGTLGVFLGDDVTDEDAFEVVQEFGFGIRVGDPGSPTLAMGSIPSCDAVRPFLEQWLAVCESATRLTP